ncbi:MAG: hypothetical protein V4671_19340 [Armatimonadota bacterium]
MTDDSELDPFTEPCTPDSDGHRYVPSHYDPARFPLGTFAYERNRDNWSQIERRRAVEQKQNASDLRESASDLRSRAGLFGLVLRIEDGVNEPLPSLPVSLPGVRGFFAACCTVLFWAMLAVLVLAGAIMLTMLVVVLLAGAGEILGNAAPGASAWLKGQ